MKRLVSLLVLSSLTVPVLAFNVSAPAYRIALLESDDDEVTAHVSSIFRAPLIDELRRAGVDAFESRHTFDDFAGGAREEADFLIEIMRGEASDTPEGGSLVVDGPGGAAEMGLVIARVAATLRVYDGRTLDLIETIQVRASDTAFLPTAIAIGGRFGVWVALPTVRGSGRRAARGVARDAAAKIADVLAR